MSRHDDRTPGPQAAGVAGSRQADPAINAVKFLSLLKRGQVPHAADAELRSGRARRSRPLVGQAATSVRALGGALSALVAGTDLVLLERPLVRVGSEDLWRPELCLLASRHYGLASDSATVEPGRLLLIVEATNAARMQQRLLGYAGAGVREVWSLDLCQGWTVRYRSPWGGVFRSRTLWYPGEEIPVAARAGHSVETLDLDFAPQPNCK